MTGQPTPADAGATKLLFFQALPPGEHMAARDAAEILRQLNAGKLHEAAQVVLVGAPRLRIVDVGEPLDLGRDLRQLTELLGREERSFLLDNLAGNRLVLGGGNEGIHGESLQLIKTVINCKPEQGGRSYSTLFDLNGSG